MPSLLPDWFQTPLGASLLAQEVFGIRRLLPPGYYGRGLQVGIPDVDFLREVGVGNRFTVDIRLMASSPALVATPDALPFGERSLDLIVLPHTLDFWPEPRTVLREISQILAPEGCVAITGFNPRSLWGAVRVVRRRKSEPWSAHFHRMGRMQDWLTLLGFELVGGSMQLYRPPLQSEKWRGRLRFLEAAGDRWWPGFAAVYLLVARRRVRGVTPLGARSRQWRRVLTGVPLPAARCPMLGSGGRQG